MSLTRAAWLFAIQGSLCAAALQDRDRPQLNFQSGTVTVAGNLAKIDVPAGWLYLQQSDARHVVEKHWGNPPDPGLLGLLVKSAHPRWGVRICYQSLGHVEDRDAHALRADLLMEQLQADTRLANVARKREGFPEVHLLGWAAAPRYEPERRALHWATKLRFADSDEVTLNYDVRLLGAEGVLVLSVLESAADLAILANAAQELLPCVQFAPGHRYADFDATHHRRAGFGVTGLILGRALPGVWPAWLGPALGGVVASAGLAWALRRRSRA